MCDLKIFLKSQSTANFVMILVSVLKNAYKVFENICFEKVMCKMFIFLEKNCEQAIKHSLPTQGRSYSFQPFFILDKIKLDGESR